MAVDVQKALHELLTARYGKDVRQAIHDAVQWCYDNGIGVSSIEQTTASSEAGGENIITITLSDGRKSQFSIINGSKGDTGATGVGISKITTVMSDESGGTNTIHVQLTGKDSTGSNGYVFRYKNGTDGKTAYEYAKDNGYTGTEEEFAMKMATEVPMLPYGGSKEWLEANGDQKQLYQIEGKAWGYVESSGWTKGSIQYLVVSSESEMINEGGTEYLLRNGSNGTVYEFIPASGDTDVPVYDSLPTTANEGDIVAVGGRKYKATLTEKQVPTWTKNYADPSSSEWLKDHRCNSSGVTAFTGLTVTNIIDVPAGGTFYVTGIDLETPVNGQTPKQQLHFVRGTVNSNANLVDTSWCTGKTDGVYAFANTNTKTQYFRFTGVPTDGDENVIITINEEIAYTTETVVSWNDIGEYIAPVEAGWSATDETYTVIDSLSASANSGESAVYSGDGYVYTYIVGAGWMALSKYNAPTLTIDGELSDSSINAVQNRVVTEAINEIKTKANANENKILTLQNEVESLGGGTSSETVTIPSYWESMIAEKTKTVKALQEAGGKNCVSFAWCGDTHIGDNDPGVDKGYSGGRSNDIGKLMAKMMDNCEIPFAVISGDIATRASYSTEDAYLEVLSQVPEALAPLWGTDRLLMALGNHDGTYGDSTGYYRKQFAPERLWQTFFRGQALDFRRVFSEDGLYFYIDNTIQKVRFIILNSQFGGEYAEDSNGFAVNNRFGTSCYGQAQLDWLADVALDMPDGYGAVIFTHVPPKPVNGSTTSYTVDANQLIGTINAYCYKSTYSGSYASGVDGWSNSTVDVDFTNAKGEIIAVFAAHIHYDDIDTTTLSCPLITILAAGAPCNTVNLKEGETAPVRYPWGTDQETSFDAVTINRAIRKIYCTRVGAGSDREVSY